ncbi:MAG: hypothetical protein WA655_12165, partial [Candidatus Korobacteraceae bacterium]
FFFINEQLLRFLNLRYPRDYNTVPRLWFWLFHLVWLFPWSVYFPVVAKLSYRPLDRAGRTRLLALCWIGFVLVFFTFSTTQEYYSMPVYPAMALLLGCAMAMGGAWIRRGTRVLSAIMAVCAAAAITILILDRNVPTPGDIFNALALHPSAYTLSLGHMEELTLQSFAYLRMPLLVATIAFAIGALGTFRWLGQKAFLCAALMMVLFFQAARMAQVTFDPYLSSRPLAEALLHAPQGELIVDRHYYAFSSVFFYTNRPALLLNGRILNLSYGSYAPGASDVFIDDARLKELWSSANRYYMVGFDSTLPRLEGLVGREKLNIVAESGGKFLLSNIAVPGSVLPGESSRLQPPRAHSGNFFPSMARRHEFRWRRPRIQSDSYNFSNKLGFINPAAAQQTRYILSGSTVFTANRADEGGFLRDRVALATLPSDGSSVPVASLHCMSPEEDA